MKTRISSGPVFKGIEWTDVVVIDAFCRTQYLVEYLLCADHHAFIQLSANVV